MAIHDHTARARPSFPPEATHATSADTLAPSAAAQDAEQRLLTLIGIARSADALLGLLMDSEEALLAPSRRGSQPVRQLALTPLESTGLSLAVHYLHTYARLLGQNHAAST